MPNRRTRVVSRFTENEVNDLILKLQACLPDDSTSRCTGTRGSAAASNILGETCKYIEKLQKEVEDLSERLSQLLASGHLNATNAHIITTLLNL